MPSEEVIGDELIGAADIARLAGVGRAAVSNWRRRHSDFPQPVDGLGGNPVFRLADVEHWLRRQRKLSTTSALESLWRALDSSRGDADPTTQVIDVTTVLADPTSRVRLSPQVKAAMADLGDETPEEVVVQLVSRLFDRQQRQHLATPPELADLIVSLVQDPLGTVFDPACGPGNVLASAGERGARELVGQEIDPALARLAAARLPLSAPARVAEGDSLRADAFPDLQADAVLCDPPFGYRDWGNEELAIDPRWHYGVPVKGEPELAWLQHCLFHAKKGGTVVMVMPAGVSSRRSGRSIRKELLRAGVMRAVLALPPGVLMSTGISVHVWLLRKPEHARADPVLLVDSSHLEPERRGRADWSAINKAILEPWREFFGTGSVEEITGRQRTIEVLDLLDDDVDLTPSRYLPLPALPLDIGDLQRESAEVAVRLRELAEQLPSAVTTGQRATKSTTTINDLARAGAVTMRQAAGRFETTDDADVDGPLVLTGRDLAAGATPSAHLVAPTEDVIELRGGDVVAPTVFAGDRPRAEVIEVDGWVLGRNVQLLRVDPDRVDPYFLAGLLRTRSLLRNATTSSGSYRIDFRRMEIPALDIDEQRRIAEQMRRINAFDQGLRELAGRGRSLAQHLTDGLAAGVADFSSITKSGGPVTETAQKRHHQ